MNVEIWCEKEALLGVIAPVCDEYGVTFVAAKGFDSESLAYESAQELRELGKPTHVYYFGDHDPSGWWIANKLEQRIRDFGADVRVRHMAVHPFQVEDWGLPTRQAKKSDSRLRGFLQRFGSDSCTELDAVPPNVLQGYVRHCIEAEIDQEAWARVRMGEEAERITLESMAVLNLQPGIRYSNEHRGGSSMIEEVTLTPAMVARELAEGLGERTHAAMCLFVRAVRELGPEAASDLAARALFIEATGGLQRGAPWNRKRTPGGVFFFLLKGELDDEQHRRVFRRPRATGTPLVPVAEIPAQPTPKALPPVKAVPEGRPCAVCGEPAAVVGKFHFGRGGKQCLCAPCADLGFVFSPSGDVQRLQEQTA